MSLQKIVRINLIAWLLCLTCGMVWALPLNQAEIPVGDRSSSNFKEAVALAYAQVLIKQSGNPAIMTLPQIKNSLKNVNEKLESYSYKRISDDSRADHLVLQAVFDKAAIQTLLEESGQTVWNGSRPAILVLLSVPSSEGEQVVSSLSDSPLSKNLQQAAKVRALQVVFPLMDLEDQMAFAKEVQATGSYVTFKKRYQVKNVLFGELKQNEAEGYQINWHLELGEVSHDWVTEQTTSEAALHDGVDKLLETLAGRYASIRSPRFLTEVPVLVKGVSGLVDYSKVMSVLRHLQEVASVEVTHMNSDELKLVVKVAGGQEALSQALKQSTLLQVQEILDLGLELKFHPKKSDLRATEVSLKKFPVFLKPEALDQVTVQAYRNNQQASRVSS